MLTSYRSLDQQERVDLLRMQELLGRGSQAFSRSCYEPGHFTASAFVLSPDQSELLLINHAKLKLGFSPADMSSRPTRISSPRLVGRPERKLGSQGSIY